MLPLNNRVQLGTGDYHTLDIISSSPYFSVVKARNLSLGREEALRISYDSAQAKEEVARLSSLSHPSNLHLYSTGHIDIGGRKQVLVMPLLSHPTLADLGIRKLAPLLTCRLLGQLLGALDEAHSVGLVYGGLSPSTLKISKQVTERLHIADYGLSVPAVSPAHNNSGAFLGRSPAYIAPERFLGAPPTPQSDIFSLGVIFYELLSGALPFEHEGFSLLRAYQQGEAPTPLLSRVDVPVALSQLIHDMIAVDTKQRCRSARDVAARLLCLDPDELLAFSPIPMQERTALGVTISAPTGARQQVNSTPCIWVFADDPAFRQSETLSMLAGLEEVCQVRIIPSEERELLCDALERGETAPPWVVLFGDMHVILQEPLLKQFQRFGQMSRVLISTHLNADMVHTAINTCGLDHQLLSTTPHEELQLAVETMLERTRHLLNTTDEVAIQLRNAQEKINILKHQLASSMNKKPAHSRRAL